MNLQSPTTTVEKSAQYIFESLCDVQNFKQLMPDNIARFEVTNNDSFIFGLKGMPEIKLKMKDKTPFSKIILGAASDKLPFTLTATIKAISDNSSSITLDFEGEFNAMMGMMIKGPISKFMETLTDNMCKL